jgi:hypothetical protein
MGSKNNPAARGKAGGIKKVGGKIVKPVLFVGKYVGKASYMAGQFEDGKMVMSGSGESATPTPFGDIIPDAETA